MNVNSNWIWSSAWLLALRKKLAHGGRYRGRLSRQGK